MPPHLDPVYCGLSVRSQDGKQTLTVRRREASEALEAVRQREQTEEFAQLYAQQTGIEGAHAAHGCHLLVLKNGTRVCENVFLKWTPHATFASKW
jgi:hypothetical protein